MFPPKKINRSVPKETIAIENRKSIVRSANTGISCFINQRGDISKATNWWESDVISSNISLNRKQTFYTKYGNVMGRSFAFFSLLLLLYCFVKKLKKSISKKKETTNLKI